MRTQILLSLTLLSFASPVVFGATYFLPGVSMESGWHDAEKQWKDANGIEVDSNMCWAAQAASMTQYWQDWYVKAGNKLPDGTPTGYGASKRSDGIVSCNIFETYKENWSNLGGLAEFGLPWYFSGQPDTEYYTHGYYQQSGWSKLMTSGAGGYFSETHPTADSFFAQEDFYEYTVTDGGTSIQELTQELMRLITVDYSIVGLTIDFWNENPMSYYGGHAVTLWGFDTDDTTNLISAIYITDSDDDYYGIRRYTLETYWDGADIEMETYLSDEFKLKYDVTIDKFTALSIAKFVAAVPEPSAFGLFAGVFALVFAGTRRRRSR